MMNSLHLILAALILSACPHKSLRPQDRDAIQHVLLLVEQQAADGPAVPIIREDGGEQPDLIVAEAARRVDHAGWRVTAVPRMIVSETREGMSASLRQLLCEVARRQAADHLLLLTWWGIVRTTGSDVADEYYVDDKRVLVDAAGYLVDCVTDRVLWRDIARGGERGEEQTLESVRRAVLSLLHSLLPGPV